MRTVDLTPLKVIYAAHATVASRVDRVIVLDTQQHVEHRRYDRGLVVTIAPGKRPAHSSAEYGLPALVDTAGRLTDRALLALARKIDPGRDYWRRDLPVGARLTLVFPRAIVRTWAAHLAARPR